MVTRSRSALDDIIRTSGWALQAVGYGTCSVPGCCSGPSPHPWTYSVGLVELLHPELVVFGPTLQGSGHALNAVGDRVRSGRRPPVGEPWLLDGMPVRLDPVPAGWLHLDRSRMAGWFAHYGRTLPPPSVLQLVWTDAEGRFPDEPGCDPAVTAAQPVLAQAWRTVPSRRATRHRR